MSKYTIDIDNLSELLDGLNNAIIAYWDIISAVQLGCQVPSKFEKLEELPNEKLMARIDSLKKLYEQLLEYENV